MEIVWLESLSLLAYIECLPSITLNLLFPLIFYCVEHYRWFCENPPSFIWFIYLNQINETNIKGIYSQCFIMATLNFSVNTNIWKINFISCQLYSLERKLSHQVNSLQKSELAFKIPINACEKKWTHFSTV